MAIMSASPDVPPRDPPARASVVIPTYHRTGPLRALLDSLVLDIGPAGDVEVILSDDGSGDDVAQVAAAYASRLPRLKYITGENAGPGVARNRGVAAASSNVLLFVDSDCLVEKGWARALMAAIESGAAVAFGPTRSAVPPIEPFVHSIVFEDTLITATNVAFSRKTFEDLGRFRREISRIAEDRDLFARARGAGIVPVRVADAVVIHPPRLKKVPLPFSAANQRVSHDLRAFYSAYPDIRANGIRENRALLAKGALKLLVGMTPVGFATFVAYALFKRRAANHRLAAAGIDLRVPAGEALKYGMLQPVNDLFRWASISAQLRGH
jgi:glycosyltransferase involved in cell wall biosynthesis